MSDASHDLGIPGLTDAERVGSGGFATVYRAEQAAFRRQVAVKVLDARDLDETARARFERECHALGLLAGHPGIVTVYDGGFTASGHPYLVMEYLRGGSLEDRVAAGGALPWREVATIGAQVAEALQEAHDAGIVHRDVKPANVLVDRFGRPQLGDFGIARVAGGHETRSGVVTASLAHAPPEVVSGESPTARSDVYSLGSTLFELLAGQAAFVKETDESILALIGRIASEPVPDLRAHGVPDVLAVEVERAMAKEPADRHESAAALARALAAAADAPAEPTGHTTVVVPPAIGPDPTPSAAAAPSAVPTDRPAPPEPAKVDHPAPAASRRPGRRAGGPIALGVGLVLLLVLGLGGGWLLAREGSAPSGAAGVEVPDVVGDPFRSGEAELRNAGFLVVVRLVHDDAPIDQVLAQDPAGGSTAEEGATVTLQVSEGPEVVDVPDLTGEVGFAAAGILDDLGLVTVFDEREDLEEAGVVIDQQPAPGSEVDAGAEVVVILSSGPSVSGGGDGAGGSAGAEVALPPVVGLFEVDARAQLESAGFVVQVVQDLSGSGELGTVTSQTPADSTAPIGSTVTIIVAGLPGE